MIPIFGTILSVLSSVTGQLGPNYDPLFFDVMVYIFGTIMFTIFLLALIAYWVRIHGWGSVSYTHLTLPTILRV